MVEAVGNIETVTPTPIILPPHAPEYQFQTAPLPSIPPTDESADIPFGQIGEAPDIEDAGEEGLFTLTNVLTQVVVFPVP